MKQLGVQEVRTRLPKLLETLDRGPIAITKRGRVRAALVAVDDLDFEAYALARNPKFADIIRRSRASGQKCGLITLESLEKELGLPRRVTHRRRTKKPTRR
jgi:antitoxin (DNA-binding transcriptional repressor) of toxin-antitoxin stability system